MELINELSHTGDYLGDPFNLRPWQEKIVRAIFATKRDGSRKHKVVFIGLPRGQGKTELLAAILLILLMALGKRGQHIYSASGDKEQAALVFAAAVAMIRANEDLAAMLDDGRLQILEGKNEKRIVYAPTSSFYLALSSEAALKHGLNPAVSIFDEVHIFPDRKLHDAITTGMLKRKDPLIVYITTAGDDENSLCYELWDYARKVRDGDVDDPEFCAILYETPRDADWKDERVWKRAMPALGDFCNIEFIRSQCRKAQKLPAHQNTFCQLFLNMWVEQAERWISKDAWTACEAKFALADYLGRPCVAGLDLSSTRDLTALVLAFDNDLGGVDLLPYFWLPGESIRSKENIDDVDYSTWVREGLITKTDGAMIDYDAIGDAIEALSVLVKIQAIGFDPQFASMLAQRLHKNGHGLNMVRLPNTFTHLNPASREFERQIVDTKLRHNGHAVLRWNVSNASLAKKAQMILPSKKNDKKRIDGVMAAVMALAIKLAQPERKESVYETRKLERL